METKTQLIIIITGLVILILAWKNWRDKSKFKNDFTQSEIKPEKHDSEHI